MRILFLLDNISIGGIPKNVLRLAASIKGHVEDYQICVMHGSSVPFGDLDSNDPTRIKIVKNRGRIEQYRHLRNCINQFCPDVLSSHGYVSQFYFSLFRRINGHRRPCAVFMHGVPIVRTFRSWLYWRLFQAGLQDADIIICVSEDTRQRMLKAGFHANKLVVILNCIPTGVTIAAHPPRRHQENVLVLGYLGRISYGKRIDVLLVAIAKVLAQGCQCRLIIAGTGELEPILRDQVAKLGIKSNVDFIGYVENPIEFLSKIDALVLLSDSEGMPVSLLEAAAAGVPIIANNVGGIPEVVRNGVNGILVPSLSAALVSEAICRLAKDENYRFSLASRQLEVARTKFTPEIRAAAVMEVYRNAVAVRGATFNRQ